MDSVTVQAPSPCSPPSSSCLPQSFNPSILHARSLPSHSPVVWYLQGCSKRALQTHTKPPLSWGPLQASWAIQQTVWRIERQGNTQQGLPGSGKNGPPVAIQTFRCELTAPLTPIQCLPCMASTPSPHWLSSFSSFSSFPSFLHHHHHHRAVTHSGVCGRKWGLSTLLGGALSFQQDRITGGKWKWVRDMTSSASAPSRILHTSEHHQSDMSSEDALLRFYSQTSPAVIFKTTSIAAAISNASVWWGGKENWVSIQ